MAEPLPLFPLGTVLLPGQQLPLHVFEDRYRELVTELLDAPADAPRRFGVVAIRRGREVGTDMVPDVYDVGCTAEIEQVRAHPDGRFDLVTTGGLRFRLRSIDTSRAYLVGAVEFLPEPSGARTAELGAVVRSGYEGYADALLGVGAAIRPARSLPTDPIALSYAVAGALLVDPPERQALLAAVDAAQRLAAEARLLRREVVLVRQLAAVPAGAVGGLHGLARD